MHIVNLGFSLTSHTVPKLYLWKWFLVAEPGVTSKHPVSVAKKQNKQNWWKLSVLIRIILWIFYFDTTPKLHKFWVLKVWLYEVWMSFLYLVTLTSWFGFIMNWSFGKYWFTGLCSSSKCCTLILQNQNLTLINITYLNRKKIKF